MEGSVQFDNPMYGVCYSFNYIGHRDEARKGRQVSLPGQFYGLTMELNIESEHYLRIVDGWVIFSINSRFWHPYQLGSPSSFLKEHEVGVELARYGDTSQFIPQQTAEKNATHCWHDMRVLIEIYRAALKGSSQVAWVWGEKIMLFCPISHSLGRAF